MRRTRLRVQTIPPPAGIQGSSRGSWQTDLDRDAADRIAEHAGANDGVVIFDLRRAAGTLHFEGRVRDGRGSGEFTFVEDPTFRPRMADLGFQRIDDDEVFAAAAHDVGPETAQELRALGFDPDFDELLSAGIFGVDRAFAEAMRGEGYRSIRMDDLVAFRIHGVTADFLDQMRDMGFPVADPDDAVAFRIHGVTPDFVADVRAMDLGRHVDADDLLTMRIHGIDADFVRRASNMGLGRLDFDDVVAMKIHGVTSAFIADLAAEGFRFHDVDDALAFRIHGIDGAYIRDLREAGFEDLDADDVLEIKIHGIDRLLRKRRK